MYSETVASETLISNIDSSPWIRGALHSRLAGLMRWTRPRNSGAILATPAPGSFIADSNGNTGGASGQQSRT